MFRRSAFALIAALGLIVMATAPGCSCTKKHPQQPTPPGVVGYSAEMPKNVPAAQSAAQDVKEMMVALSRVHFSYNSAKLLPGTREAIATAAERLAGMPSVRVYVAGHCDERGTEEYNLELGERRAKAVAKELMRLGVPADRLTIVSHGKDRPAASGRDEVSYARNRRVEFEVLQGAVRLVLDEGTLYSDRGKRLAS